MKTIKVMSIIGIVIFGISLVSIIVFMPVEPNDYSDIEAVDKALGWGIISTIWGIAYAITCLAKQ